MQNRDIKEKNDSLIAFLNEAEHDLKQLLRAISFNASIFLEDYANTLEPEAINTIKSIQTSNAKLANSILALLKYERITQYQKDYSNLNSKEIADDVIDELEVLISEKKATVTVCSTLPNSYGDRDQAHEVFYHLILNALTYNDNKKPKVEISANIDKDGNVVYFIKDNGIGISEKYKEKIFKVFKQIPLKGKSPEGTGLGLCLVKKIIGLHGGNIWVVSEENEGSTFFFTLAKEKQAHRSISCNPT